MGLRLRLCAGCCVIGAAAVSVGACGSTRKLADVVVTTPSPSSPTSAVSSSGGFRKAFAQWTEDLDLTPQTTSLAAVAANVQHDLAGIPTCFSVGRATVAVELLRQRTAAYASVLRAADARSARDVLALEHESQLTLGRRSHVYRRSTASALKQAHTHLTDAQRLVAAADGILHRAHQRCGG